MSRKVRLLALLVAFGALLAPTGSRGSASAEERDLRDTLFKGLPIDEFLSSGGEAALFGPDTPSQTYRSGEHSNGRTADRFVNDPCLDPAAPGLDGTIQSEPEIAVLNAPSSMGQKMVAGYNDTAGSNDRNNGLSGYAYSVDGGTTWIDGGGAPACGIRERTVRPGRHGHVLRRPVDRRPSRDAAVLLCVDLRTAGWLLQHQCQQGHLSGRCAAHQ
jgi:hypothetical protein